MKPREPSNADVGMVRSGWTPHHMIHPLFRVLAAMVLGGAMTLAACQGDAPPDSAAEWSPPIAFGVAQVTIHTNSDTVSLGVELADSPERRAFGLMDRPALDPDRGMLFTYSEVQDSANGFWMFRTLIPLDIAFVDSVGTVVAVRSMEPCQSPNPEFCPTYTPGVRYTTALEVNRGYLSAHGVAVGDSLVWHVP